MSSGHHKKMFHATLTDLPEKWHRTMTLSWVLLFFFIDTSVWNSAEVWTNSDKCPIYRMASLRVSTFDSLLSALMVDGMEFRRLSNASLMDFILRRSRMLAAFRCCCFFTGLPECLSVKKKMFSSSDSFEAWLSKPSLYSKGS